MELEFDKEIDAILRKSRTGVAVNSAATPHLDADSIAAFSENALPQSTKLLYTRHFADCDNCRKKLSLAIQMNTGADATTAPYAAAVAPAVSTSIPWYSKILRSPSIAIAMGGLILVFTGVLGYLFIQNRKASTEVSQVSEPRPTRSGPVAEEQQPSAATNSNAASTASANTSTNAAIAPSPEVANRGGHGTADQPATGRFTVDGVDSDAPADKKPDTTTTTDTTSGSAAAPPPAPVTMSKSAPAAELKDAEKNKEESRDERKRSDYDDRLTREAVPAPMKKVGPNRAAGPRQSNQNQVQMDGVTLNNQAYGGATAPVKNAGGKKFQYRNGAWYDTAYIGQATKNVSRSSAEFGKLDAGLRGIANTVGGVVVIVWKGAAYRIQ